MTTIIDKRLNWKYKGCEIIPIACHRDSNWGKEAEPIDFGFGMRSRYWRIDFPDKTWIHVATKPECREYINSWLYWAVLPAPRFGNKRKELDIYPQ